ncbi:vWA domain-containing protein [Parafilimonas terrae]|uniref:Ca-activated chloride channel family protein n=1 Tax=Parafilimonas terrae TaxID=1465490 RepID=A0A1I5ZE02_9BACT|nr:VWA domain-containing protein [Parafilimonas terrae]SFQ54684.1 Ca-activated chloride channel family protein [Parafilimonas terrae]
MKKIFFAGILLALLSFAFTSKTNRTITGTIQDENGKPVMGASVVAKGTKNGVVSDANGKFSIVVDDRVKALEASSVGYKTATVKLSDQSDYTIVLKPQISKLDEVVVAGYGSETADIALNAAPVLSQQLSGKAAGIYIRGNKSMSYSTRYKEEKEYDKSWRYNGNFNTEGYDHIVENPFLKTNDNPLSTFSIDVDAASYANVRRFINDGRLPPAGAVRIEEMINYFNYSYPQPQGDTPFSINTEISNCPWNAQHKLVMIGLQGKKISTQNLPASNLVFLIDVSGSMNEPDKLPLVQSSLKLLVDQLRPQDKVALVVYAGNAGLVLPSTSGDEKMKIKDAINALEAGGSTAGRAGIQLAYKAARNNFIKGGNNRVILCTDGDFNVGQSSEDELQTLIEKERSSGIFLSVLGFGTGNYQDAKMQTLADKGNGNHNYIDNISEAKKVFVNEFGGTLFTIAKDVKLQIEFNPDKVQGYRLIGYENRLLNKEDFNDDKKDAGELGSGHTVTALYELIPAGIKDTMLKDVDALRYQKIKPLSKSGFNDEVMNIKLRYKEPDGDKSVLIERSLKDEDIAFNSTSGSFRFATAVAAFGMLLRDSEYKGEADFSSVKNIAQSAIENDDEGYRKEFINLVKKASSLKQKETASVIVDDNDD